MKKSEETEKNAKKNAEEMKASRMDSLVDSLELISARMLEMVVLNNQLASSQTPEMRSLFQKWIGLMSDELLSLTDGNDSVDLVQLSERIGISRATVASLLVCLDRKGDIEITGMQVKKGDGKNKDICDCIA